MKSFAYRLLMVLGLGLVGFGCSASHPSEAVIDAKGAAIDEGIQAPEGVSKIEEPAKEEAANDTAIQPTEEVSPAKPAEEPLTYFTFTANEVAPAIFGDLILTQAAVKNVNVHWEEETGSILLSFDAVLPAGDQARVVNELGQAASCKDVKPSEDLGGSTSRFALRCSPKKKNVYVISVVNGAGAEEAASKVGLNFGTAKVNLQKAAKTGALAWSATIPFELTIDGGVTAGKFTTRTAIRSVRLQHYDVDSKAFVTDWVTSEVVQNFLKDLFMPAFDAQPSYERYLFQLSVLELDGGTWQFSDPVLYTYKTQFEATMSACDGSSISIKSAGIKAFVIDCGDGDYDLSLGTPSGLISVPTRDSADWSVSHGLLDDKIHYYNVDLKDVSGGSCVIRYVTYDGMSGSVTPTCN